MSSKWKPKWRSQDVAFLTKVDICSMVKRLRGENSLSINDELSSFKSLIVPATNIFAVEILDEDKMDLWLKQVPNCSLYAVNK